MTLKKKSVVGVGYMGVCDGGWGMGRYSGRTRTGCKGVDKGIL